MTQVDKLVALLKTERPLHVPMGKADNKTMALVDLVLDLRLDNEQLRQENAYLRQLLQEMEENPDFVAQLLAEPSLPPTTPDTAVAPHPTTPATTDTHDQNRDEDDDMDEPIIDWEALYFETRPSLPFHHHNNHNNHSPHYASSANHANGNGHNGNGRNGHISVAPAPPAPKEAERRYDDKNESNLPDAPQPTPTTIEAISMEQLMADIVQHERETPDMGQKPVSEPDLAPKSSSSFAAILRDPVTGRRLAELSLDGPLITSRDLAGNQRRIWGFQLVDGNLRAEWRRGKHLYLCLKNGTAVRVRIAGLPSDASNNGFVELV